MTHQEIMQWAARWHHPRLILEDGTHQPHGRVYYDQLATRPDRAALVSRRIEQWNARITASQVGSAIARIERMKARMARVEKPTNSTQEETVKG